MKNKFTGNARDVIVLAEKAASNMSSSYVGTEHLLLGLLNGKGVAATTLRSEEHTSELQSRE